LMDAEIRRPMAWRRRGAGWMYPFGRTTAAKARHPVCPARWWPGPQGGERLRTDCIAGAECISPGDTGLSSDTDSDMVGWAARRGGRFRTAAGVRIRAQNGWLSPFVVVDHAGFVVTGGLLRRRRRDAKHGFERVDRLGSPFTEPGARCGLNGLLSAPRSGSRLFSVT